MANKYIRHGATYNGDGLSSAVASGSTVTFTIASPGKVNWTGHGLAANALVYFGVTTAGVLPTGITAGTTYYVRNPGTNDFEISATSGGASINFSGTPSGTANCTTTGAWNHIDIFLGSVAVNTITGGTQGGGSIVAGDVIYIRSKTEAGANITSTLSGSTGLSMGNTAGTLTAPLTWIIDGGTIWTDISGTIFCENNTVLNGVGHGSVRNNNIIAEVAGALHFKALGGATGPAFSQGGNSFCRNALFDSSTRSTEGCQLFAQSGTTYDWGRLENCSFKVGRSYGNPVNISIQYGTFEFVNCDFELLYSPGTDSRKTVNPGQQSCRKVTFLGGRVYGTGATTGKVFCGDNYALAKGVHFVGFQYPVAMTLAAINNVTEDIFVAFAADNAVGAQMLEGWGTSISRQDNNPPRLNATLPNSTASTWSWYLYPYGITATPDGTYGKFPALTLAKMFTDTAAAKTITLEMLIGTAVTGANRATVWMDVIYIDDTTGTPKWVTTKLSDTTALDTSTAGWDATTWGAVSFNKRKLSATTPTSIKKDTTVIIRLAYFVKAAGATEVAFVCPDVQLT